MGKEFLRNRHEGTSKTSNESNAIPQNSREILSLSQERQLHLLFDDLDRDKSGCIEPEELKAACKQLGLPHDSTAYVKEIFKQFGSDGTNSIDFDKFKEYAQRKEGIIAKAFHDMDIDGSGAISVHDLERVLKAKWLPLQHEDAARMIHLLDRDHNNVVSYEEFRSFVYLLPESSMNDGAILQSWVDSADWVEGIEYHVAAAPPKQGFNRFLAGGVAGGFSRTVVAPFERLRIMMMADSQNSSFRRTAIKMWKDGGIAGLFKGNFATLLKVMPQTATQFAVYDSIQAKMVSKLEETEGPATASDLSKMQHLAAGALAGAAATTVTYPIETVRTQLCMGGPGGMAKVTRELWSSFGLKGCFRGVGASFWNASISNALGFTSYEMATLQWRKATGDRSPSPAAKAGCAGLSACAVMATVMPLENVQRRLQVQGREGHPVLYSGSWDCAKRMLKAEGVAAFWRGSLSSFLKVAPSLAAVRFAYELAMRSQSAHGLHKFRRPEHEPLDPPDPNF